jgi:hypothetical protein
MRSTMQHERDVDRVGSRRFTRWYLTAFAVAALIGFLIGLVWIAAGLWQIATRP